MKTLFKVSTAMSLHVLPYNRTRLRNILGLRRCVFGVRVKIGSCGLGPRRMSFYSDPNGMSFYSDPNGTRQGELIRVTSNACQKTVGVGYRHGGKARG